MSDVQNKPAIQLEEQKMIGKAVLLLINQYPNLKKMIGINIASFNYLDKEKGIALFTSSGAVYLSQDITGGYTAQYPFEIAVKKPTGCDADRIALSDFLDSLASYVVENREAINLDDSRTVDSLEQTTLSNFVGRDGSSDIYRVGLRLKYKGVN